MKSLAAVLTLFIIFGNLSAEAKVSRNQRRENHQDERIDNGTESGTLNKKEQRRLQRGQNRVDEAQENAVADGDVTKKEKVKIEKMQDVQSKRIYRQKHDGQNAHPGQQPAAGGQ